MISRCRRPNAAAGGHKKQFNFLAVSVAVAAAGLGLVLGVVGKSRRHARQGQGKVTRCIDSAYNDSIHSNNDKALSCLAEQLPNASWAIQVYQPWSLGYGKDAHSCPLPRCSLTPDHIVNIRDDSTPAAPTPASVNECHVQELRGNVLSFCPPADGVTLELPSAFLPCAGDSVADDLVRTGRCDARKVPRLSAEVIDVMSPTTPDKSMQVPHSTLKSARSCSAVSDLTSADSWTSAEVGLVTGVLQLPDGLFTSGDGLVFDAAPLTDCAEATQEELVDADHVRGISSAAAVVEELLPFLSADPSFGDVLAEGLDWEFRGCDGSSSMGSSGSSSPREGSHESLPAAEGSGGFDVVVTVTMGNPLFTKDRFHPGNRGVIAAPSDSEEDSAGEDPVRPPSGQVRRRLHFSSVMYDNPSFSAPASVVFNPCFSSGSLGNALPAALPTSMMAVAGSGTQPSVVSSTAAVGAVLRLHRNPLAAADAGVVDDSVGISPGTATPLRPESHTSPQPPLMVNTTLQEDAQQVQVQNANNASADAVTQQPQPQQEQGLEQLQVNEVQVHHLKPHTLPLESTREVEVPWGQDLVPPPATPVKPPPLAATIPASPTTPLTSPSSLLQITWGSSSYTHQTADPSDLAASSASSAVNSITSSGETLVGGAAVEALRGQACSRRCPGAAHGRSSAHGACDRQRHPVAVSSLPAVPAQQTPGWQTISRPCASPLNTASPLPKSPAGAPCGSGSMRRPPWCPSASAAKSYCAVYVTSATGATPPGQSNPTATAALAAGSARCDTYGFQEAGLGGKAGGPHLLKALRPARSDGTRAPPPQSRPPFRPAAKCKENFKGLAHIGGGGEPKLKATASPSRKLPKWATDLPSFMRPTQASLVATAVKASVNTADDSPAGMRTRGEGKVAGSGRRPDQQDPRSNRPRWR